MRFYDALLLLPRVTSLFGRNVQNFAREQILRVFDHVVEFVSVGLRRFDDDGLVHDSEFSCGDPVGFRDAVDGIAGLDGFLERGAISQAQHDKSLRDLVEKMGEAK